MICPECGAVFIPTVTPVGGQYTCPLCEQYTIPKREWFGEAHNRRAAPPLDGRDPAHVRAAIDEARDGGRRPVSFKTWEVSP